MNGIVAYGSLLPVLPARPEGHRRALWPPRRARARGRVASYDEDTTSMGVEAARAALRGAPRRGARRRLLRDRRPRVSRQDQRHRHPRRARSSTTRRDGLRHAGLDPLWRRRASRGDRRGPADAGRPLRHPHGAAGRRGRARRRRRRGGVPLARRRRERARARRADRRRRRRRAEFLERWRVPGDAASRQWEERFGEHVYVPLADAAITERAEAGGRSPRRDLATLVVAGPHGRANKRAAAAVGAQAGGARRRSHRRRSAIPAPRTPGSSSPTRSTAPQADDLIAVVSLADGCDVIDLAHDGGAGRAGASACRWPSRPRAGGSVSYATFLTWRGFLKREPPRRPDPEAPAAPPSFRRRGVEVRLHGQPLPGLRDAVICRPRASA